MKKKTFLYSFYSVFLFVFTVYIGVEPYYNMDMLAYMAIVEGWTGEKTAAEIHESTYSRTKEVVEPEHFKDLTQGTDYREHLWKHPESFNEQLAFYVIKPLYLASVYALHSGGTDLLFSTILPSLICFFFIGLLILYWFDKIFHSPWLSIWISTFIITSVPFVTLGKTSAPDAMSTLFVLMGCFLFIEKVSLWRSSLFFIIAIGTRPDNVILVFMIFLLPLFRRWHKKVPFPQLAICLFLFFMAYFIPTLFLENVAWSTLFHHAFISRVLYPLSAPPHLDVTAYFGVIMDNLVPQTFFARSQLMFIVFFAGLIWWKRLRNQNFNIIEWSFNELFMFIIILTIGIRFLLFPAFMDRFMAPFLFLSTVLFFKEVYPLLGIHLSQGLKAGEGQVKP